MKSLRVFKREIGVFAAAGALILAAILPTIASAAQLTERSVGLSSASANASNVSYQVEFTPASDAGAVVIDFCSNSPLVGQVCNQPAGFSLNGATVAASTPGYTRSALADTNTIVLEGDLTAGDPASVIIEGVHNPTSPGAVYARIVTYDTATNALTYDSDESMSQDSNRVDEGGAAFWILDTIGVSAAVMESMTFCVSKTAITANCANPTAPTLQLGQASGDVVALIPSAVSEGTMWAQISTNAAKGAIISLKSSAIDCGGLVRVGGVAGNCDIKPATAGITSGNALFGVKTGTAAAAAGVTTPDPGTLQPYPTSGYNSSTFLLNYNAVGNATGVTSTFGDKFLDTDSKPADSINMPLTFGASVNNNTPAGLYSVDLSMIATGKF